MSVAAPSIALNDEVRAFWERQPCGTDPRLVGRLEPMTPAWFAAIERYRYETEPMIHAVAQFTRHQGQRLLEIGVGAGTDHVQWARAGAICHGVDLTEAAIATTRAHLAVHGLDSELRRVDAETLPFEDASFDVVYSWGVIHHSERPDRILAEARRVLRPGGKFIGMMYGRRSVAAIKVWVRNALLRGQPWRSLADVLWHHVESAGTKAYTVPELQALFRDFAELRATPMKTVYDTHRLPTWVAAILPDTFGWFIALHATK